MADTANNTAPSAAWSAYGSAVGSGVLYALGFCGFDQAYLAWICLTPLLYVYERAAATQQLTPRLAFKLGWLTGLVAHLGCYFWLVYMLRHFAYLPLPLALLGYVLLCGLQSSLFGVWGWVVAYLRQRTQLPIALSAPLAMVVAEWLYPALFPSYLANSQYRQLTVLQSLELWGALGLSWLLLCCNAALAKLLQTWRQRQASRWPVFYALCVALLLAGNTLYGTQRLKALRQTLANHTTRVKIGLVQTNMGIYEKSDHPAEGLWRHRLQSKQLAARGAELIIWPESGYYFGIDSRTTNVQHEVLGDDLHTPLLFGGLRVVRHDTSRLIYNTAFLTDAQGNLLGTYDKIFLLTFGEYLPLGDSLPFLYSLSPQTGHFSRGEHTQPLVLNNVRYGVLICYEDILPRFVRRVMQQQPDVLVNITNDAWFGDSFEPKIHLALGLLRAVEHRRYLVRAANTGISSIIEPTGAIRVQSGIFERTNLLGEVVPLQGSTFYARHGDFMGWLAAAVLLLWLGARVAGAKYPLGF